MKNHNFWQLYHFWQRVFRRKFRQFVIAKVVVSKKNLSKKYTMNSIKLHDVVFAMMMISLTKILKKSLNLRETRFSRFRNMIRVTSEQKTSRVE